jgi:hypothetical protein
MHYFSTLFGKELYMFRADLLSIIRSPNTVFTAMDIDHTSYVASVSEVGMEVLISLAGCRLTGFSTGVAAIPVP